MNWTSFKETNLVLGAGGNPNTGDLPVAISFQKDTPNVCFMVSKWKMTDEERAHFEKTGEIYLSIMARVNAPTQPPVSLMVFNPFENYGYEAIDPVDLMPNKGDEIPT